MNKWQTTAVAGWRLLVGAALALLLATGAPDAHRCAELLEGLLLGLVP